MAKSGNVCACPQHGDSPHGGRRTHGHIAAPCPIRLPQPAQECLNSFFLGTWTFHRLVFPQSNYNSLLTHYAYALSPCPALPRRMGAFGCQHAAQRRLHTRRRSDTLPPFQPESAGETRGNHGSNGPKICSPIWDIFLLLKPTCCRVGTCAVLLPYHN